MLLTIYWRFVLNILSLFNGLGGLPLACDRAGISYDKCYYSEIDKYANMVMEKNYPDSIPLGDVTKWKEWDIDWSSIGLVSAGFPCQAWSVAGQQQGDKDERGMLFWTTLEVISQVLKYNPNAKFLMENVKMKKEFEQYITYHTEQALGDVEKILINSALVSAQNRNRYYWTNFKVEQPDDKGVLLKDILEDDVNTKWVIDINKQNFKETLLIEAKKHKGIYPTQLGNSKQFGNSIGFKNKAFTLRASNPNGVLLCNTENKFRKLTPLECERLQTLPDNWTDCVSNTQRYKMIGNGWTIDVIAHILKHISN